MPFERAGPAVLQPDVGADHEIPDGAGHQDLAQAGGGHDPGADVDRDPAHVIAAQVHLAGVEACSDLALSWLRPEHENEADSPTQAVEDRQDAVAGCS